MLNFADGYVLERSVFPVPFFFGNFVNDLHAAQNFAEDHVLSVEKGGRGQSYEKLGAVGVWTSVCHREETLVRGSTTTFFPVNLAEIIFISPFHFI